MAALLAQEPAYYGSGQFDEPDTLSLPIGTATKRGDIGVLAAGVVNKAAANAASGVVGLIQFGSVDIYYNSSATDVTLFGVSTANTALMSSEPANVHLIAAHNFQPFEISLIQAWSPSTQLGAAIAGINIDGTTGFFVADTTQTNKILNVIGAVDGPTRGTVGDTFKRVIVTFTAASVAI